MSVISDAREKHGRNLREERASGAESFRWYDGIKGKEIKEGTKGICINTYGNRGKKESGEDPKECDRERNKTIR